MLACLAVFVAATRCRHEHTTSHFWKGTTCTSSPTKEGESVLSRLVVSRLLQKQEVNEIAVDASHFTLTDAPILGVGGFGIVRLVCKISSSSIDGALHSYEGASNSNNGSGFGFGVSNGGGSTVSSGKHPLAFFAIKSLSKRAVLSRSSGPANLFNELTCLKLLANVSCPFVANFEWAFQDSKVNTCSCFSHTYYSYLL